MAFDSIVDEVLQVGFTCNEKILTDTGKHLGTSWGGVCLGDFEGKFLTLGGTNQAESCPCSNCHWWFGQMFYFSKCSIVHVVKYNTRQQIVNPVFLDGLIVEWPLCIDSYEDE